MFVLYHDMEDMRYPDGWRKIKLLQSSNKQELEKYIELAAKIGYPKNGKYVIEEA